MILAKKDMNRKQNHPKAEKAFWPSYLSNAAVFALAWIATAYIGLHIIALRDDIAAGYWWVGIHQWPYALLLHFMIDRLIRRKPNMMRKLAALMLAYPAYMLLIFLLYRGVLPPLIRFFTE